MPWEHVSDDEAIEVKYYGVRGWLKFFYVLAILGLLRSVFDLIYPDPIMLEVLGGSAGMMQAVTLFSIALQIPFLVLTPIAHPLMPSVTIVCTWIQTIFILTLMSNLDETLATASSDEVPPEIFAIMTAIAMIVSIGVAALWTWYLLRSKRVNVTYRSRVRDWELVLRSRGHRARTAPR